MQLSASLFSDPTARPALEKYYENKKTEIINTLKAREADPSFQATMNANITMPDGTTKTLTVINRMTAEMAEKSLVSFDEWMSIMADTYESSSRTMEMAQKRLDMLKAESPESSSNVRSTFSANGQLLAYINADGSLVTSNIGPAHGSGESSTPLERRLQGISQQADALGLSGQSRIDFLNREVKEALSQAFGGVNMTTYGSATSPSKKDFAKMWSANFDVTQVYNDALADAQASYDSAKSWHQQWQKNLNDMHSYLLSLQEAS